MAKVGLFEPTYNPGDNHVITVVLDAHQAQQKQIVVTFNYNNGVTQPERTAHQAQLFFAHFATHFPFCRPWKCARFLALIL